MGHERLGILPKTRRWVTIVNELSSQNLPEDKVAAVSSKTIQNVQSHIAHMNDDSGVIAALKFLVALSVSAQFENPFAFLLNNGIVIGANASPYFIAKAIHKFVSTQMESREYGEIARSAAVDAISKWHDKNRQQLRLFESDTHSFEIWRGLRNGAGFCEIARMFFAKSVERYINYFLERVLSSLATSIVERELLSKRLSEHLDITSKYAFETARITQSFAAGWFNRYAKEVIPTDEDIRLFSRMAFGKLREELGRDKKT